MKLNKEKIKQVKKLDIAKKTLTNQENDLLRELLVAMNIDFNFIKDNYSIYETCLLLESKQNSIGNKGKRLTTKYNPGEILMVDLGVNIYGYEFSYEHPCVVMLNENAKIFVIPCTSQPIRKDKSGKVYKDYVEGLESDGFAKKTTLLLTECKFIDKTRVKSRLGKVTKEKLFELEDKLFGILLPYKKYALEKVKQNIELLEEEKNVLSNENENIKSEIVTLREEKNILSNENENIKRQNNQLRDKLKQLSMICDRIDEDNIIPETKRILDDCV